jgi:uncharacterized damage-inducible protein DinB
MKHENGLTSKESQARRLEEIGQQLVLLLQQPDVAPRIHSSHYENDWSVMQTLGHLVEMLPYWTNRCCVMISAVEEPLQFGRELDAPERLEGINHGTEMKLGEMIFILNQEIQGASQAIRSMSEKDRKKMGIHIRYGEISVTEAIERLIVTHSEEHLNQVRSALQIK